MKITILFAFAVLFNFGSALAGGEVPRDYSRDYWDHTFAYNKLEIRTDGDDLSFLSSGEDLHIYETLVPEAKEHGWGQLYLDFKIPSAQCKVAPQEDGEFQQIKEISEYFLKVCPPATCVLLGLGRSPTPVMAYIQGLPDTQQYAWNFPLSKFHYGIGRVDRLLPHREEMLYAHLGRFLPNREQLRGRSVLAIDWAESGTGLLAAQPYLQTFFNKLDPGGHGPTVKIAAITDSSTGPFPDLKSFRANNGRVIQSCRFDHFVVMQSKSELAKKFHHQEFDDSSEFGSYEIGGLNGDNARRPQYQALLETLKSKNESVGRTLSAPEESPGSLRRHPSHPDLDFLAVEQKIPKTLAEAKIQGSIGLYEEWLRTQGIEALRAGKIEILKDSQARSYLGQWDLKPLLKHTQTEIRILAAEELAKKANWQCVGDFVEALSDPSPEVREVAVQALEKIEPQDVHGVKYFAKALQDSSLSVRSLAAKKIKAYYRGGSHALQISQCLDETNNLHAPLKGEKLDQLLQIMSH